MLRFERANLVCVLQREPDVVQAVQEAMLAEGFHFECKNRGAVDGRYRLPLEPFLCLLAARGAWRLAQRRPRRA